MRKVITILLLPIFFAGCSLIGRSGKSLTAGYTNTEGNSILEGTINQNITNNGFFIQKAEIEIISNTGKERYLASIKFEMPDKYLISVKSRSGIEGVRIYISGDSILLNDRINKKLYSGNAFYLKRKFGLTPGLLPLIFGDAILDTNCQGSNEKCSENKIVTKCHVKGVILNYEIDCKKKKVVYVNQEKLHVSEGFSINFKNFIEINGSMLPKIIEFSDNQYNTTIRIKILKIETPWKGSIIFIPGKGYESIEIV